MFKPLLRTLPLLTGNVMLDCQLEEYIQDKKDLNMYVSNVRKASLKPLQNKIYNKKLNVDLLNGSWEFDVKRYYKYYSNYFYLKNFLINTSDYKTLDIYEKNETQDSRNKDYEMGAKRIQYSQHNSQFNIFAPIWVENENDIPDYIDISFIFGNNTEKHVKINIGNKSGKNYLYNYIYKFLKKIDNNIIFCMPKTNQAAYSGIDLQNGGIVTVKDDVFGILYNNQNTMNNFDYTVCSGFKRHNMMICQVIPLSFSFNINDFLSYKEQKIYANEKVSIKFEYYKGNINIGFYDFSINYDDFRPPYLMYDTITSNMVVNKSSKQNIMDIVNPSLYENRFINYKYSNKITPIYCRWKMMHSPDDHPYISNMSFAFSSLDIYSDSSKNIENISNYRYGDFPTLGSAMYTYAFCEDGNFMTPKRKNIYSILNLSGISTTDTDDESSLESKFYGLNYISKYIKLQKNSISSWYDVTNNPLNTSECKYTDVVNNQAMFNGILYNFNNMYDSYGNIIEFDKFGVFINPSMRKITSDSKNKIIKSKYSISFSTDEKILKDTNIYVDDMLTYSVENRESTKIYNSSYNDVIYNAYNTPFVNNSGSYNNAFVENDKIFEENSYGLYVNYNDYFEHNKYFKYGDIQNIFSDTKLIEECSTLITDNLINSYESINVNINNIITYSGTSATIVNSKDIFSNINNNYSWISSYMVSSNSSTSPIKNSLYTTYTEISTNNMASDYDFFIKSQFISSYNFTYLCENWFNSQDNTVKNKINSLKEYNYIPYSKNELITDVNFFKENKIKEFTYIQMSSYTDGYSYVENSSEKYISYEDFSYNKKIARSMIYVDPYSLERFGKNFYGDEYSTKLESYLNILDKKEFYAKFINKDHIKEYFINLKNNEKLNYDEYFNISGFSIYYKDDVQFDIDKCIEQNYDIWQNESNKDLYPIFYGKTKEDIKNLYFTQYDPNNILNYIYVKERYLCNDQTKNLLESKDSYITLSSFLNKYAANNINVDKITLDDIIEGLTDPSENTLNKFSLNINSYTYTYNSDGSTTATYKYFSHFSYDGSSQISPYIDLCFKKKFYPLIEPIYNMMNLTYNGENNNIYDTNMFYLYVCDDCMTDNGSFSIEYTDIIPILNNDDTTLVDINDCLTPLFTDVYINDKTKNRYINMLNDNNFHEVKTFISENTQVKTYYFSEYDSDCFIQVKPEFFTETNNNNRLYKRYIMYNLIEDELTDWTEEITSDKAKSISLSFYDNYGMNIFTYDNKKYGFFIINVKMNNTDDVFRLYNESYGFTTIDGESIENQEVINKNFKKIHPYLKNYIFQSFTNNVKTIINIPKEFIINIDYKSVVYDNGSSNNSYKYITEAAEDEDSKKFTTDIIGSESKYISSFNINDDNKIYTIIKDNTRKKKISLSRYFGYISPLITESHTILKNTYHLRYKSINDNINEDNIYSDETSINRYKPLKVAIGYDKLNHKVTWQNNGFTQFEYKHYNDSLLYNLMESMEYKLNILLTYSQLSDKETGYESEEKTLYYFMKCLNKYHKYNEYKENEILFLFNKYKTQYISESKKLNLNTSEKLYSLTYKFTLI